ncbi:hypothetical protein LguiA_004853 [Lonicera macranthoides]
MLVSLQRKYANRGLPWELVLCCNLNYFFEILEISNFLDLSSKMANLASCLHEFRIYRT